METDSQYQKDVLAELRWKQRWQLRTAASHSGGAAQTGVDERQSRHQLDCPPANGEMEVKDAIEDSLKHNAKLDARRTDVATSNGTVICSAPGVNDDLLISL